MPKLLFLFNDSKIHHFIEIQYNLAQIIVNLFQKGYISFDYRRISIDTGCL